jgi:hypothetical protein
MGGMERVLADMDIRGPLAVWVLSAHFYALLVPLALVWAAWRHADYLAGVCDYPGLFYFAGALFCTGSAFEVAQNTADRWYLTPDTPSANGVGMCDFLSYWFVGVAQALISIAIAGDSAWVWWVSGALVLAVPFAYFLQVAEHAPLGLLGILVAVLAWLTFGDPVVFLMFALTGLTLFFFAALLKTGAQVLHGFTTIAASSGVLLVPLAIANGAADRQLGWLTVATLLVLTAAGAWALHRPLNSLPRSPRVTSLSF